MKPYNERIDGIASNLKEEMYSLYMQGYKQGRKEPVLDQVRAKIEKQIERDFAFAETETQKVPYHYGIATGLQNAIRIIDSIGSAEGEVQE